MTVATTRWSVVAAAQESSPAGRRALAELCGAYWYPLYAFARRRGASEHDASEQTQAFFADLLERDLIARADPARGRFRSFLFASFRNFLANWRRAERAEKRGGLATTFSIDAGAAEERYLREPQSDLTPERIFERRWAFTVLEHALGELRREYETKGKGALFERLKPCLLGDSLGPYDALAAELQLSVSNVKITVHRLRQRFRDRLRRAVADTVDLLELPSELDHLRETVNAIY